jgi:hypothetical protein
LYAESSFADSGQALLKSREPAIHGAAFIYRTPWVILGLGTIFNADASDANSQHE